MHSVTSSLFFSAFLSSSSFFPPSARARILEWKARFDLANYVSRGSPELLPAELSQYDGASSKGVDWQQLFDRVNAMGDDDGHTSKLLRAIAHGAQVCAERSGDGFVVGGKEVWRKAAAMGVDGAETGGPQWLRSCGFEQAWKEVPLKAAGSAEVDGEKRAQL